MKVLRITHIAVLAILLFSVVPPVVAQGTEEALLEVLKGNQAVEGWKCTIQQLTKAEVCYLEVKVKEGTDIPTLEALNSKLSDFGFHLSSVHRGGLRTYNSSSLDFCNIPPGGVLVPEPAPQPRPDEAQPPAVQSAPASVATPSAQTVPTLPQFDPAGPDLIAGLGALVSAYAGWLLLFAILALAFAHA